MLSSISKILKGYASRNEASVLIYHGLADCDLPFPIWTQIEVDQFEQHIKYIASHCHCISVSELVASLRNNRLAPCSVVVTFDDGFASNLHKALPILEHYNVPATVFVSSGFIGSNKLIWPEKLTSAILLANKESLTVEDKIYEISSDEDKYRTRQALVGLLKQYPASVIDEKVEELCQQLEVDEECITRSKYFDTFRLMTRDELLSLAGSELIEIGAHTVNHTILSRISDKEAWEEISQSKEQLEQLVGKITSFAYPNGGVGDYSKTHERMLQDAGYEVVFSSILGTVKTNSNLFELNRIGIGSNVSTDGLSYMIKGGVAFDKANTSTRHLVKGLITGVTD